MLLIIDMHSVFSLSYTSSLDAICALTNFSTISLMDSTDGAVLIPSPVFLFLDCAPPSSSYSAAAPAARAASAALAAASAAA